jgi:hypothetical protein
MIWIPLWVDKWIFGSTRIELKPDERAVWIDLMALAAKDNGWVRANPDTAYPIEQLAGLLCISKELLERSIQRFIDTGKIQIVENSFLNNGKTQIVENSSAGYFLTNWQEYSLSNDYKKRISKKGYGYWKDSEKHGIHSQNSVTIVEKSIEENSKEEGDTASSIFYECEFFKIEFKYHEELIKEFPLINFHDLYVRLRNDCLDNSLRYKKNVHGHIKNVRNVVRNWCIREKPVEKPIESFPKKPSLKAMIKCQWCGIVYHPKDDHQCSEPIGAGYE